MGARNWYWHLHHSPDDHILAPGDAARALKASRQALRDSDQDMPRTIGDIKATLEDPPPWLINAQERKRAHRAKTAHERAQRQQNEENLNQAADDYLFLYKSGVSQDDAFEQVRRKWRL